MAGKTQQRCTLPRLDRAALLVAAALAAMGGVRADVLPSGPRVVGGSASVSHVGNKQTVQQYTDRAIIDWNSFSIGAGAGVRFVQPRSTSVILNRVVGNDPSRLLGTMSANGRVFLVNPHGIFFGAGAQVDTGALVASTMDIANDDFLSGRFLFTRSGPGRIENAGTITIRDGGFALLAADDVRNTGRITAPGGNVMLASAERVTIDTRDDGLVGFSVEGGALREVARVQNSGTIAADGGRIALTARGARELTGMVVNNTGVLRAASIEERDGAVILSADAGTTTSSGGIDVSGQRGGLIEVSNASGTAQVSGVLDASGQAGRGGSIRVAGRTTGVMGGAVVDASGTTGGDVRIGGDWRGGALALSQGAPVTSQDTYVAGSATIGADGRGGAGGSVVVWADRNARFDGRISARGAGDAAGGDAEISGREHLDLRGDADLGSDRGAAGTLLLDPERILITDSEGDGSGGNPVEDADGDLPEIFAGDPGATSRVSRGKLESLAGNANIVLEATQEVRLQNLAGNELALATGSGNSVTLRTTAAGSSIVFDDLGDRIRTSGGAIRIESAGSVSVGKLESHGGAVRVQAGGNAALKGIESGGGAVTISGATVDGGPIRSDNGLVQLTATQGLTAGNIRAGNGDVRLTAGTSLSAATIETDGNVRFHAGGAVTQQTGTRIRAAAVNVAAAGSVALERDNEVDRFSATTSGSTSFRSVRDLTVDATTVNGSSLDVRTTRKLTLGGAVGVDGGSSTGSLRLEGGKGIDVGGHAVEARGRGGYGQRAASVVLRAVDGDITQTSGTIRAIASGSQPASTSNLAHYAEVTLSADDGRVSVQNVSATSNDGRAQVNLNGHDGVAVGQRAEAIAASQPGVVINGQHNDGNADVDTRNAVVRTVLTAEAAVHDPQSGSTSYKYIFKPVDDVGGIGIAGRHLSLGTVEAVASDAMKQARAQAASLAGISTLSHGNTTFHGTVRTDALTGINVGTSNDGTVVTDGSAILRGPALSVSGDPEVYGRGVFRLKTDVASLTVVGGRGVDIDNTAHSGQLVINALGRISPETTLPGGEVAEATNMPIGGFRIRSRDIKLLSLDNRTQKTYQYDGANTNGNRQDFVFEADRLEVVPGTIKTRANTLVHLRPLTSTRKIVVGHDTNHADTSVTYYSGGPFGLLGMLHPEAKVYIGNYGGQTGYTGDIVLGGATDVTDLAKQISLGSMELHFYTAGNGRVINNYGGNDAMPVAWADGDAPTKATLLCPAGQACLARMTDGRIYLRDSRMQGSDRVERYVYLEGQGTGAGGTRPEDDQGVDSSGGGGSGPGGGPGGSNGGGGNDSDPGGSNAPPDGPGGGGNGETNDPGDVGPVVGNPGQGDGNPGPGPGGDPTDPEDPTTDPGADTGDDGGLSGGGEWSGDPGDDGPGGGGTPSDPADPDPGPGGGGDTSDPSDPGPGGGGETSDPDDPGPGGGGETSDPTDPGPGGGGETSDPSDPGPGGGGETSDPGDPGSGPGGGGETSDPSDPDGTGGGETSDPGDGSVPGDGTPDGEGGTGNDGGDPSDPGSSPGGPGDPWQQPGEPSSGPDGGGEYSGDDPGEGPSDGGTGPGGSTPGGDGTSGSGDGTSGGDGTPGAGDGTSGGDGSPGSGDGTSGGGDGTPGSGDGTSGGGDGTPGSGDGTAGGGDGTPGSNDGTTGSGDGSDGSQGDNTAGNDNGDGGFGGGGSSGSSDDGGGDYADGGTGGSSGDGSGDAASGEGSSGQDGTASGDSSSGGDGQGGRDASQAEGGEGAEGDEAFVGGASGEAQEERAEASEEEFVGGGAGGAQSEAGTSRQAAAEREPPPCADESAQVRALSRPGEPAPGLLSARGSGVRLRNETGTLQQQRIECEQMSFHH